MRFSNRECLDKMLLALCDGIAPQLPAASNAMVALGVVRGGIEELLKRELVTPEYLKQIMPEGSALAQQQVDLLEALGSAEARELRSLQTRINEAQPTWENVAGLQRKYNDLVDLIDRGAQALFALKKTSLGTDDARRISDLIRRGAEWEMAFQDLQAKPLPATGLPPPTESTLDPSRLEAFIADRLGRAQSVKVSNLHRLLGGYGKETWLFDLTVDGRCEPMVLRRNNLTPGMLDRGTWRMVQEFPLIQLLFREGAFLPEPLWLGLDVPGMERTFYVARRLPGRAMGTFMRTNDDVKPELWLQVAEQLAKLHSIPIARFSSHIAEFYGPEMVACSTSKGTKWYVDWWFQYWSQFKRLSSPLEIFLFDWLYSNLPNDERPAALVHSDFGPHNLLADGQRLTAILDWESPFFGSPGIDLAYVRRWVTQTMEWDRFVGHYEACGGRRIDDAEYAFCNTLTYMRTVTGTNAATASLRYCPTTEYKELMLSLVFMPKMMRMAYDSSRGLSEL